MDETVKSLFGNLEESSSLEGETEASSHASLAVARKFQASTRVSLLVEALVRSVVSAYETDSQRSVRAYKKICRRLFQMGLIDESWSMGELEGARIQFEHALLQLLDDGPVKASLSPLVLQAAFYTSQYKREFDEFEKIGGGGFGKVFRVKHRLDGREYAVKKIPIHSEGIASIKNYLSEVKTLASLNHPNIVQYKAAWLELGSPVGVKAIGIQPVHQPKLTISPNKNKTEQFLFCGEVSASSFKKPDSNNSNFEIEFEHSSCASLSKTDDRSVINEQSVSQHTKPSVPYETKSFKNKSIWSSTNDKFDTHIQADTNSDFEIEFRNSQESSPNREKSEEKSSSSSKICILSKKQLVPTHRNHAPKPKIRWATLYIQMALCHGTLDQWLKRRNESFDAGIAITSNNAQALRTKGTKQILIQILRGLEYIHSRGVVHHDIKPSNIFVSAEGGSLSVQLGDFGLACPLQRASHGFARGTPLYAAPEQLTGRCDSKSDIYSLGIVLFELLEDFSTDMERTRKISELRGRTDPPIPPDLTLSNLVSALVRRRAVERPDASTLLKALESGDTLDVDVLEKRLQEKEREIERLKELLRRHGLHDEI